MKGASEFWSMIIAIAFWITCVFQKEMEIFQKNKCSLFWNARPSIMTDSTKAVSFLQGIIYRQKEESAFSKL